jgi:pSer/pThr/pTyr-binding forkhead associated (FHA) protein
MPARLVSLDGTGDIPVNRRALLVGRHPLCDARLPSHRVSRIHCCLLRHSDGFTVRDLRSTNGTRINGRRSESGRLEAGDELAIAHLRYRLEVDPSDLTAGRGVAARPTD